MREIVRKKIGLGWEMQFSSVGPKASIQGSQYGYSSVAKIGPDSESQLKLFRCVPDRLSRPPEEQYDFQASFESGQKQFEF